MDLLRSRIPAAFLSVPVPLTRVRPECLAFRPVAGSFAIWKPPPSPMFLARFLGPCSSPMLWCLSTVAGEAPSEAQPGGSRGVLTRPRLRPQIPFAAPRQFARSGRWLRPSSRPLKHRVTMQYSNDLPSLLDIGSNPNRPVISWRFFGAVLPPIGNMISEHIDATRDGYVIVRPNCSVSWRTAMLFLAGICAASLTVAVGFAVMGYWPILPFAGAELLALGGAVYLCQVRASTVEVISLSGNNVAIEKGRGQPSERWEFDRHWVQVALLRARFRGHPSQLVLRSHGQQVVVGDFLAEDERTKLAKNLRHLMPPASQTANELHCVE
ncbi:MAG: DUF2244 domain-containing protein [Pseudomonadota bacterium]